jgi:hypothetical protein
MPSRSVSDRPSRSTDQVATMSNSFAFTAGDGWTSAKVRWPAVSCSEREAVDTFRVLRGRPSKAWRQALAAARPGERRFG